LYRGESRAAPIPTPGWADFFSTTDILLTFY
jgi:hypothetical protein